MSAALISAMGILLLLASTSLSALHAHEVAPNSHSGNGQIKVAAIVSTGGDSVPGESGSKSDPLDCELCHLSRRGDTKVAILTETPVVACESRGMTRAEQSTPEAPRALAAASAGPRAPPFLSA